MGRPDVAASIATLFALAAVTLVACGGSDNSLFSAGATGGAAGASSDAGAEATSGAGGSGAGGASGTGGAGMAGASGAGAGGSAGSSSGGTGASAGSGGTAGGAGGTGPIDAGGCDAPATYYSDADQDGYGDPGASTTACAQPAGYVANHDDCYDGNAEARPGQQAWFAADRGDGSYDYDCSGAPEKHWTGTGACTIGLCGVLSVGWQGAVAECGATKAWITTCTGLAICAPKPEQRTQECH